MKRTITVRTAALTAAAALGLVSLGYSAAVAAQPDSADASSITETTGNLHIHKFTPTTKGSTNGNGTQITDTSASLPGAEPIEGITFKAYKINGVDIHKNADWVKMQGLADSFNAAKGADARKQVLTKASLTLATNSDVKSKTTGENGDATFSSLPVGFYYVEEVKPNGGSCKVASKPVDCSKISGVDPFLVSVPLTNPTDHKTWMYDVHVYPKNQITKQNEKSVKDIDAHGSGNSDGTSNIVYTIKTNLPVGTDSYNSYVVVDPLDPKLTYIGDQSNTSDTVKAVTDEGREVQTFQKVTDYTIATGTPDAQTVILTFTRTGRGKLINARNDNHATKVQWELNAKVNATTGKTEIPNTAYQLPSNEANPKWDKEHNPGNPTNKVISKYGKVVITKKGVGKNAEHLAGAKFELYMCTKDDHTIKPDQKVSVGGKSQWESASGTGQITIDGLRLNDWINDSSAKTGKVENPTEAYCLKEVEAPKGYELLPEPIEFQLLTTQDNYTYSMDVKDVPSNGGFHLPVTGGQGIALLAIAGGLLVAGSVIYTVAATRKRRQNA